MIELSNLQKTVLDYPSTKMVVGLPCGKGKTIATLVATKHAKRIIVVMPKILIEDKTWEKNKEKIGATTEIITISKEQFRKYHKELPPADCLILDEFGSWAVGVSPVTKSSKGVEYIVESQIHTAIMWYIKEYNPQYLYLLDATCSAGKPMTLWATRRILGQLNPSLSEKSSFEIFRDRFYIGRKKGYSMLWLQKKTKKAVTDLSTLWKTMGVFFEDSDSIPPIEEKVRIEKTPEQENVLLEIGQLYSDPLVLRCRNFMALNGAYSRKEFDDATHKMALKKVIIPTNKERWILEFIKKEKKQVVIFATFKSQIQRINEVLNMYKVRCEVINGDTKNKGVVTEAFRQRLLDAIIVQSSICSGWEAPECDTIIRASQPTRADHAIQQQGRIDRMTNKKQNYTYDLIIPGTVDEEAYNIIKRGEDIHFATLEEYEEL